MIVHVRIVAASDLARFRLARPAEVLDLVYDLFIDLGCDEHALEFPVIYCNARAGTATTDVAEPGSDLRPLFDMIVARLPPPQVVNGGGVQILVSSLDYNNYVGRLEIGRVFGGSLRAGSQVAVCRQGGVDTPRKVQVVYTYEGLQRKEAEGLGARSPPWPASRTSPSATPSPTPLTPSRSRASRSRSRRSRSTRT